MSLDEPPRKDPVPPDSLPPARPLPPRLAARPSKVYSVPRRFDLATMFVVSFAFALMFGAFRMMNMPTEGVVVLSALIVLVGVAQPLLFKGLRPRLASFLTGGVVCCIIVFAYSYRISYSLVPSLIYASIMFAFGGLFGYLSGLLVGTVFMLAEFCRIAAKHLHNSNHTD